MRLTMRLFVFALVAVLWEAPARAQIASCGTNARGDSLYCGGTYVNGQGGMITCNCSSEPCVEDPLGPPGVTGMEPLCTSTGAACGNGNPACTGYSTCVNGGCCQPQTKAGVCACGVSGIQPDGCGGTYDCGTSTCVPLTIGVTSPVVLGYRYEVQLTGGPPNTAFSVIFVGPDNTNYPSPATTDSHGNWASLGTANSGQFPQLGTWAVQAQFTTPSEQSNYFTFTVTDHFPPVPSPALPPWAAAMLFGAMGLVGLTWIRKTRAT